MTDDDEITRKVALANERTEIRERERLAEERAKDAALVETIKSRAISAAAMALGGLALSRIDEPLVSDAAVKPEEITDDLLDDLDDAAAKAEAAGWRRAFIAHDADVGYYLVASRPQVIRALIATLRAERADARERAEEASERAEARDRATE